MEFVYIKSNFNLANIFVLKLFKMAANQIECFNRGLPSNFCWLRSTNHVKFTEECLICIETHILVKKIFTNRLNLNLTLQAWIKKTVHGGETHWISSKEKVLDAVINKEGHTDNVLGYKRLITVDFFEKDTTVNSVSYCQLLRQNFPYLLNDPGI